MPTRTAPTPDQRASTAALSRCVGDAEAFLAERFTRAPHLWHAGAVDDLLSLADVDAQLTGAGLRRPAVRVVRDGDILDPASWTKTARTGRNRIDDLVDPGRLLALFGDGATIVLQSLQRWWPPLTRFCRSLELALGHPMQANAYLTPPGAAGLAPHHDTHDVFVLQVHGTKQWTVREPLVVAPLPRHTSDHERCAQQPVLFEVDLRTGDCLYLPRGFVHSAATQDGSSLHLTIGVLATTAHDVLRRIVDRAADEPTFRRTIRSRTGAGEDDPRALLKEIVAELAHWLDALDLDALDDDTVQRMLGRTRRPPVLDGQLLELVGLGSIDDATAVVRRAATMPAIREIGDRVEIDVGDRKLQLPAGVREPLARLLDGAPHTVGELSERLDHSSRRVLVRRLVREGVLRTCHGA